MNEKNRRNGTWKRQGNDYRNQWEEAWLSDFSLLGIRLSILSLTYRYLRRKSRTVPISCGFVPMLCQRFLLKNSCRMCRKEEVFPLFI